MLKAIINLRHMHMHVTVKVSANSANVLIPEGKSWWAWSDEPFNFDSEYLQLFMTRITIKTLYITIACSLKSADYSDPLNDTCDTALDNSDGGSGGFTIYMYRFLNKTTPLLNPGSFIPESVEMKTFCPSLPCGCGIITYPDGLYYVMAIEYFNKRPVKVNFKVPWHIDCDPSYSNNSSIPSSSNS